ncbi:MAG: OmpA family protein [Hyphomicrobium sp.]
MRRSVWAILAGLALAILASAAVAKIAGLPFASIDAAEKPIWHLLRTALPIAAFALPGALTAILLAEARRVRGLAFWLFVGGVLAAIGYLTLTTAPGSSRDAFQSPRTFMTLLGMGLVSGFLYWWAAGRQSGNLAAAIERSGRADDIDDDDLRRRCRGCTALTLLLGLLPLAMIGWHMLYKAPQFSPAAIVTQAEAAGTQKLADAGVAWAKLDIEDHVGRIAGTAPDASARIAGFETAKTVLAPMVGLPGVVAYLQNDIAVPEAIAPRAPTTESEPPKPKSAKDLRRAAEAKAKAEQAERRAVAKAAAEKAAQEKAAEDARLAADAKRQADEATAAAKARAIAEERAAADARQRAEDEKGLADDLAAQRKADEDKRLALEAQTERAAVEAARKAEADKAAAATPTPGAPVSPVDIACANDFSTAFRDAAVQFAFRSAAVDTVVGPSLDGIAAIAKRCTRYSIAIGGHADRTGIDAVNQAVSLQRAEAVRDALVARGVEAARLKAEGFGAQRLIDTAKSRAANRLNRRVDFSAALTPAVTPPPAASPPAAPALPTLPIDQCNSDFSRAILSNTIRFTGSSAIIDDAYADDLDVLARLALSCPSHVIAISGHTDRRGSVAFNQRLSEERANAVRDALIDRDVPEARVTATGYGGGRPFDPANTSTAYALNRRVDLGVSVRPASAQ